MGDILLAIPPLLSCSANCSDVLASVLFHASRSTTCLSSKRVSPPKTAPMNTPSGLRMCLAWVKEPDVSCSFRLARVRVAAHTDDIANPVQSTGSYDRIDLFSYWGDLRMDKEMRRGSLNSGRLGYMSACKRGADDSLQMKDSSGSLLSASSYISLKPRHDMAWAE